MKILKVTFPASTLRRLPEEEQVFLVRLTRLLNEINILAKCAIFAGNALQDTEQPEKTVQRIQGFFFLRELAGKLWEGWDVVHTSYFGSALSKEYDRCLSATGKLALAKLKNYFGRSDCSVKKVRNEQAFHYDVCVIRRELAALGQKDALSMLVAPSRGNCLYTFSEHIAAQGMLKAFDTDAARAMRKMIDEVAIRVPNWFQDFGAEVLMVVAEKAGLAPEREYDLMVPSVDTVRLPFFVGTDPE